MNTKTIIGSLLLIMGFLAYQTGVAVILNDSNIVSYTNLLISKLSISNTTLILLLEFGGGILAIIGFLLCMSGLVKKVESETKQAPRILNKVEGIAPSTSESSSGKCKYCGAEMEGDMIFCPKCNKAQT